jgi:type IV pilus assembly protein PilC
MAFEDWFLARVRVSSKQHARIKMEDKTAFFQQLSTLVSSGTSLLEAIQIASAQNQSTRMQAVLADVAGRVSSGCSLHDALAGYRHVFEDHWIELMRTGEITGKMALVLNDLNQQIRDAGEMRRRVVGALIYPAILILVAVLVVTIMLWFVVPTFADMFEEMGAELPSITLFVISTSDFISSYGIYIVASIVAAVFAFRQYIKTDSGQRRVGAIGMATPVVGDLMIQSAMYRFSNNIGLMLKSGVPILETLTALSAVFRGSPIYQDAIRHTQRRVAAGRSLADSLEETGFFTAMITNTVHIGEESGQLAMVMEQIAPFYKEKMQDFLSRLTKLLEPLIIVGMGGAMTVLMLSIYMPMFEMAGKVN